MQAVEYREGTIQCPFDPSHVIRKYRIQTHLFKCQKNYPNTKKVACPFDATHFVDPINFEHHINTCPSSGNVRNALYVVEPERSVGTVPIEEACTNEPVFLDEDWNGEHATYNPISQTETRTVTRVLIGASKAQRKAFKKAERERLSLLEKLEAPAMPISPQKLESDAPLRLPKCTSKAQATATSLSKMSQDTLINTSLSAQLSKSLSLCEEDSHNTESLQKKTKKNIRTLNDASGTDKLLLTDDSFKFQKPEPKSEKSREKADNKENNVAEILTTENAAMRQNIEPRKSTKGVMPQINNLDVRCLKKPSNLLKKEQNSDSSEISSNHSDVESDSSDCAERKPAIRQKGTQRSANGGLTVLYSNSKGMVWDKYKVETE